MGGMGGSLKTRIVAGIASNRLYAAIAMFEAKNFPGHHVGFFDPGGPMFKKLEALATPAPPTAPPAPPAPPPPAPPPPLASTDLSAGPVPRLLTSGEKNLLRPIFGDTIKYDEQLVSINFNDSGGEDNSFTPGYHPNMSRHIWSVDYSNATLRRTAVFVHEMVHVWQSGHGSHNFLRGAYLMFRHGFRYGRAYPYNLDSSAKLTDFNLEQQAAIIEDYYFVSRSAEPGNNVGTRKSQADYEPYVQQLRDAGPFRDPPIQDHGRPL